MTGAASERQPENAERAALFHGKSTKVISAAYRIGPKKG
jgi:hypothetical protein